MAFIKLSVCAIIALLAIGSTSAQEKVLSMAEFKAGIDSNSYDMVIDVRSQSEWDEGHIPTAIHVPMSAFSEDELWKKMEEAGFSCQKSCATIVAHCKRGVKSKEALTALRKMGFEGTLYDGMGTQNWLDAGYELTTEDDSVEPVCASSDICPLVAFPNATSADMEMSSSAVVGTMAAFAIPAFLAVL